MKKLLVALALLLGVACTSSVPPTPATAQCSGVFPGGTVCGNPGVSSAPPGPFPTVTFSSSILVPSTTTSGDIVTWGNTNGTQLYDPGLATGTTGHTIPFLDGRNTFSGSNTFTTSNTFSGNIISSGNNTYTASQTIAVATAGTSAFVGSLITSGGIAASKGSYLALETSGFFSSDVPPANINFMNDRVFIGDFTKNAGALGSSGDWFCTFQLSTINVGSCYMRSAQLGVEVNLNSNAGVGIMGAAQTTNMVSGSNVNAVAIEASMIVSNAAANTNGFSFYGECHQQTSFGTTGCIGMEIDVRNAVALDTQPDPFTQSNLVGVQGACGAGLTTTGHDCGAAYQVVKNPTPWRTGLLIVNGSIDNTGPSSEHVAVAMPTNYGLAWFSGASAQQGAMTVDPSGNVVFAIAGALKVNTSVGVNCTAGTTSAATMVVVGGIVTHC